MSIVSERSYELLTEQELVRLGEIAARDLEQRFARRPRWRVYADRIICVALCQGAALHYVDRRTGVKDLDVWTFFATHDDGPFPPRWRTTADFGRTRFGRRATEPDGRYEGRRVDLIGRSLEEPVGADPVQALERYLRSRRTDTARLLADKAVVLLQPAALRGTVAWPAGYPSSSARS